MNRLLAINFVLTGIILGALMAWACNSVPAIIDGGDGRGGDAFGPGDAFAQGPSNPTHTVGAESNLDRMEMGVVNMMQTTPQPLVTGPIIVTDLLSGASVQFQVASASDCATPLSESWEGGGDMAPTGMRLPIAAGQQLCAFVTNSIYAGDGVLWTGFRPY